MGNRISRECKSCTNPVLVVAVDAAVPDPGALSVLLEGAEGVADYASATDSPELLAPLGPSDSPLLRDGGEMCRVTRGRRSYWRTTQYVMPQVLAARLSVWTRDAEHWSRLLNPKGSSGPGALHPYWHWKVLLRTRRLVACVPSMAVMESAPCPDPDPTRPIE